MHGSHRNVIWSSPKAARVLFALNDRYLINEKGALQEAALLPLTIPHLVKRAPTR
ncbi:hypothetical protein [Bradyrhizobium sp. Y36]|uniref:hypothetical protein n=1 Tax=Bradyrhizobium sp. Y36 TaxID=2035447 RepID=UPI001FE1D4A8|nr:hypothetical protein [Bradyrhizobium sp. Y36]